MAFNVGIILIGSLYWDDKPHRIKWRHERLQTEKEFVVNVPIRYGRKSNSRGNTFTMVFSPGCKVGQAKVLPCRAEISSVDDLITEAEFLWDAEQPDAPKPLSKKKLAANWGCVALLWNASLSERALQNIRKGWADRVSREPTYDGKEYEAIDGAAISPHGLLHIQWPCIAASTEPIPFDFLLTTVTKPSLDGVTRDYPSLETIVDSWKLDKGGNVSYFWGNIKSEIQTFQDEEILKRLKLANVRGID